MQQYSCHEQGTRSNFEIGGGHDWILGGGGGTIHFFLLTLYNFKNIGGGGGSTPLSLMKQWK